MTMSIINIFFWILLGIGALIAVVIAAVMKNKRGRSSKPSSAAGTILTTIVALSAAGLLAGLLLPIARRSHVAQPFVTISHDSGSVAISAGSEETTVFSEQRTTSEAPDPVPARLESDRQDRKAEGHGSWLSRIASGGAVAILITLAYLFLDAGTRGRYTWPLRFGSIAVFAGFCVLLWRLRPMISILKN